MFEASPGEKMEDIAGQLEFVVVLWLNLLTIAVMRMFRV
jgi:hypothetical protein